MAKMQVVKKVKNAVLYDNGMIRISNVRFSYPHLRRPYKKEGDDGEKKYSLMSLLPKKTHAAAKKLIDERIAELLKENKVKSLASDKKFLRDGDETDRDEDDNCWTVSARETRRPSLRDEDKEIVDPEDADEIFYGGAWGTVLIRPWFQKNDYGKRVNAGLSAVRKTRDDEPFGEGRLDDDDVDEAFDDDEDWDEDEGEAPASKKSKKSKKSRYEDDDDDDDL